MKLRICLLPRIPGTNRSINSTAYYPAFPVTTFFWKNQARPVNHTQFPKSSVNHSIGELIIDVFIILIVPGMIPAAAITFRLQDFTPWLMSWKSQNKIPGYDRLQLSSSLCVAMRNCSLLAFFRFSIPSPDTLVHFTLFFGFFWRL